ncbi:bifunctional diguanylate cyclase/phosphodiesterase [Marinicella sp. S1101]|uniref:putative bifunctional diguanylate cyclase/phosphodiesterase n=1 Tax=Marinicella marina TaxID=2996016 RepID=UPI002260F0B0|nr:bifunctional diguanylate cyclase/phosphodiesterase [Marinicella marina]MCX7554669.1 bifunctional diguanylate cyclase/phosphodiesterase [Marinicella marina]MDJ1140734.1 bifunctional diguanylate cyclase/phosphodiesterase [Marinicella marina]
MSLSLLLIAIVIAVYVHRSQDKVLDQILKGQAESTEIKVVNSTLDLFSDIKATSARCTAEMSDNQPLWRLNAKDFLARTVGAEYFWLIDSEYEIVWSEPRDSAHQKQINEIISDPDIILKLVQTRESGQAEISQTYSFKDQVIVYIFQPIGDADSFNGFYVIGVLVDKYLDNILGDPVTVGHYTKVYSGKDVVYANGPDLDDYSQLEYFELNMDTDSDSWLFKVYPTNSSLDLIISPMPYFIAFAGAIIALLFMLTLRSQQKAKKESLKLANEISEKEKIQFELEYLANHDTLTHLPNRHYITNFIKARVNYSKTSKQQFTVLFIDLDHFKDINDTLGHAVGDEMLKKLPVLFNRVFRHDDVIARMGGDEFIVYLPGEMSVSDVEKLVERFLKSLEYPIEIGEHLIRLTGSVGVAFFPQHGANVTELLSHADAALYRAKDKGRNTFAIYDSEIEQKAKDRIQLISKLHTAHEQDEFEMYYQPRYDLASKQIIGAEALIRWNKSDGQVEEPAGFIELLEETSLIIPVSWKMLSRCCKQFGKLLQHQPKLFMSFNVSAKQLEHPDFLVNLQKVLKKTQFPAKNLELELTEQTLIQNVENSRFILDRLKEMGIAIAIDDFGTGYSSLSYLKNFQVDILKIDKSFIQDIDSDKDDLELVKTMIAMGQNLNITTVAEGVENEAQIELLSAESCDQGQGYYFRKAMKFYDFYQLASE